MMIALDNDNDDDDGNDGSNDDDNDGGNDNSNNDNDGNDDDDDDGNDDGDDGMMTTVLTAMAEQQQQWQGNVGCDGGETGERKGLKV